MPTIVPHEVQRGESAEKFEGNRKGFAASKPSLASENHEAGQRDGGIDDDRDGHMARHVAARRNQFQPGEQEEQCASRPGAEPVRTGEMQRQALDPWSRYPLEEIEQGDPGIDQYPEIADECRQKA